MSTAHTATPWMVVHELRPTDESVADLVNDTWVIPANGQQLGSWHADAAFIVRAVNAHDDLVKSLQDASEILHLINNDGEYDAECKACRAALTKAGAA